MPEMRFTRSEGVDVVAYLLAAIAEYDRKGLLVTAHFTGGKARKGRVAASPNGRGPVRQPAARKQGRFSYRNNARIPGPGHQRQPWRPPKQGLCIVWSMLIVSSIPYRP